ncbi:cystathione beta-lyase [Micrococcales bacterium KH10]|nr:cystathione beta-lyase [Micrococcales bacterium KH10]
MIDPFDLPAEVVRTRTSEKWQHYPADVLPVWVAEMDVAPASAVVAAVEHVMRSGDTGYASGHAYHDAFARFAADRWQWSVNPKNIATVPNVMLGMIGTIELVLDRSCPVVTSAPVYPPLMDYPRAAGYEVTTVALDAQSRLDIDAIAATFARLAETASPGKSGYRGAYLLCNPHNPTGVVPTAAELRALGVAAREHGFVVISDEIHAPLSFVPFTPVLTVIPDAYAVLSASKAWNLAGLNVAAVVSGDEAVYPAQRVAPYLQSAVSHVAITAHIAALRDGADWLDGLRAALLQRRELLGALLAKRLPMLGYREPEGTYLAWLDFAALASRDPAWATNPAKKLLAEGRVALSPGAPFGAKGFARFNFATSQELLIEAVDRIAAVVR